MSRQKISKYQDGQRACPGKSKLQQHKKYKLEVLTNHMNAKKVKHIDIYIYIYIYIDIYEKVVNCSITLKQAGHSKKEKKKKEKETSNKSMLEERHFRLSQALEDPCQ